MKLFLLSLIILVFCPSFLVADDPFGPADITSLSANDRLATTLTLLHTASSSNPTAPFWKEVTEWLEEGGGVEALTRFRLLTQEFERRVQTTHNSRARALAVVLHDEKFKAEASGNQTRKDLAKTLAVKGDFLETLMNCTQYSGVLSYWNESQPLAPVIRSMNTKVELSSVLVVVESLFLITEKLPDSAPVLKEVVPLVDDILGLERFAKLELEKKAQEGMNKLSAAYKTAFDAYKLPFHKRPAFRYGLGMLVTFSLSLAVALWILLRRPNMQQRKPMEKPKGN